MRYVRGMELFDFTTISIHPIWEIDEKAIIILVEFMLNCDKVPINIDRKEIIMRYFQLFLFIKMISGMIFCHVSITAIISHFKLISMGGIQLWSGAAASLIIMAVMITAEEIIRWGFAMSVLVMLFDKRAISRKHEADV